MKFDKAAMAALLSLDDAALWEKICGIAAQGGVALSKAPPPASEMQRLRALMSGAGQGDVASAMQTIARYKQGR